MTVKLTVLSASPILLIYPLHPFFFLTFVSHPLFPSSPSFLYSSPQGRGDRYERYEFSYRAGPTEKN